MSLTVVTLSCCSVPVVVAGSIPRSCSLPRPRQVAALWLAIALHIISAAPWCVGSWSVPSVIVALDGAGWRGAGELSTSIDKCSARCLFDGVPISEFPFCDVHSTARDAGKICLMPLLSKSISLASYKVSLSLPTGTYIGVRVALPLSFSKTLSHWKRRGIRGIELKLLLRRREIVACRF
jgi:hypothetical protein